MWLQEIIGKTVATFELDEDYRFGFNPQKDTALRAIVFSDGTRLEIDAIMAGANDSEPYARAKVVPLGSDNFYTPKMS